MAIERILDEDGEQLLTEGVLPGGNLPLLTESSDPDNSHRSEIGNGGLPIISQALRFLYK